MTPRELWQQFLDTPIENLLQPIINGVIGGVVVIGILFAVVMIGVIIWGYFET